MTGNEVLTLMHEVVAFEGTPTDYTLGQKIVRWNHTTNTMDDIFNIFDIMDPREVVRTRTRSCITPEQDFTSSKISHG